MTANKLYLNSTLNILSIALLLILVAGFTCPSSADNSGFKIFKVLMDSTKSKDSSKAVKDFYVNAGSDDGLTNSMILDVYRKKRVLDKTTDSDLNFSIHVGKVKVFKLYKDLAITRLHSLTTTKKTPVLEYRTVMIGDNVVPKIKKIISNPKNTSRVIIPASISKKLLSDGLLLPSNVLFNLSAWKLKPEALNILSSVNNIYAQTKDKDIIIEGHTCSLGTNDYNMELSRKRAQTVAEYFKKYTDIPAARILIDYHGENMPVTSNTTKEGREKNRRVIIRFIPHYSKNI